jgi:hypothetical protein
MYVYDLEVFSNLFSGVFINTADRTDVKYFVIHQKRNDSKALHQFISSLPTLIGYNNHNYDDLLLNLIYKKGITHDTARIKNASTRIIESANHYHDDAIKPILNTPFRGIDLMKLLGFDKLRIGLKHIAVNMRHPLIQDLPKHHDSLIGDDEIDEILAYNYNDVAITLNLYDKLENELYNRSTIEEQYNVDVMSASDSMIADTLMSKFYTEHTGQDWESIKNTSTDHEYVNIGEVLDNKLTFSTNRLKQSFNKACDFNTPREGEKSSNVDEPVFGESKYTIGLGGLHSDNPPQIYQADDNNYLIDVDAASYYPRMLINMQVCPAHLSSDFPQLYQETVAERLRAKANKKNSITDSVLADSLKIVINSIFGKMGYKFSWLYDLAALYKITMNGQYFLLMLIEWLEVEDMAVVYANTDGITARVPKAKLERFYAICKEWEQYADHDLEYSFYHKMIIRDVNNYLIIKTDGGVKEKGAFVTSRSELPVVNELKMAFNMPVVAEAVHQYFVNNIYPEDFIPYHEDIIDFCISQKVGGQYEVRFFELSYDQHDQPVQIEHDCQKTNRFYVSKTGGKLMKYKKDQGSYENLVKGRKVTLLNRYESEMEWNIDYTFYISQSWKMIGSCTNHFQTDLFT